MKRTYEILTTYEGRLDVAQKVAADFEKLETEINDYTIVDDGQDRWIAETDDYLDAVETVLESILDGTMTPDPEEGLAPAYDKLCTDCPCLYSRMGTPSDEYELARQLVDADCDAATIREIFEALGLGDLELPAMIDVFVAAGDKFSGGDPVGTAQDWADNDFDAEESSAWVDAGFWDASVAAEVRDAGLTPEQAVEAAQALKDAEPDDEDSRYTDGDPIYSACNGDTPAHVLVDAAQTATCD